MKDLTWQLQGFEYLWESWTSNGGSGTDMVEALNIWHGGCRSCKCTTVGSSFPWTSKQMAVNYLAFRSSVDLPWQLLGEDTRASPQLNISLCHCSAWISLERNARGVSLVQLKLVCFPRWFLSTSLFLTPEPVLLHLRATVDMLFAYA